ncbi:MAG: PspA/IM30 family protein [Anaerolineae bacterium]|nr:PspA/IM30 family protein [Anaerolineae bacterium]MDW8099104.1 PspA/IM30 family protein [Anaerolineae bacterium]
MASLLEKVDTLIRANLHALVDRALNSNSLAVLDQYIRQIEDHLEDLEDAAATVGGQVKTLKRKVEEYDTKVAELDRNIDLFLQEGREELAVAAQSKFNATQRLLENYREQLQRQEAEYQKLLDAKLKLEARLTTVKQEREELRALLDLAKSKEVTVRTIKSLDDLVGVGDADIARVAESIRARLDKAQAQAEMYAQRLDVQMDEVLERHVLDAQLAERKKRLGIQ